jgi:chromate transporter
VADLPLATPAPVPAAAPTAPPIARRVRPTLGALSRVAAWLGIAGFGGGLSVLGAMHAVLVVRRRWLTEREFLATATISQMLPGGAAANALAYTGLRFFGVRGAVAAYAAFIAPGAAVVTALAAAYVHLGASPRLEPLLAGLNAAVVGIVASITLQMVRTGVSRAWQMAIAAGALVFAVGGAASAGEVAVVGIGCGLVLDLGTKRMRLARLRRRGGRPPSPERVALPDEGGPFPTPPPRGPDLPGFAWLGAPGSLASAGAAGALAAMALLFVRTGLGAYGGGFAIIPHLQATVLAEHWVTPRQFADAVAIGKLTPGPVLLMATFIGYLAHGVAGAAVATLAVFSGPLALVVGVGGWLARVRSRRPIRAALRGLTPAVVGLMAAATLTLGRSLDGAPEVAIAAATVLTLARFRLNPVVAMALGAAARLGLRAAGI